jgi:hypothetical protein
VFCRQCIDAGVGVRYRLSVVLLEWRYAGFPG